MSAHVSTHEIARLRYEGRLVRAALANADPRTADGGLPSGRARGLVELFGPVWARLVAQRAALR